MATKDIWIFSATENLEGELVLEIGTDMQAVVGIEKLVNIFVHTFFTELGSDLVYNDTGTAFAEAIGGNLFFRETVLRGILALAVSTTRDIIREDQIELEGSGTSIPDDEYLSTATLLTFSESGDTIDLTVELVSRAGTSRVIKVPQKFTN